MFKIRTALAGDDVGSLKEILERRFKHEEWRLPNLIVVDGGKTQLRAAQGVLATTFINPADMIPSTAVTKDDFHRPKIILGDRGLIAKYEDLILSANAEAHRFAVSFHRRSIRSNFINGR